MAVTPKASKKTIRAIAPKPAASGNPAPKNAAAVTITAACIKLWLMIKIAEARTMENLDARGATSNRFKKPNSRSNITGKPAFSAPAKAVKTITPAPRN